MAETLPFEQYFGAGISRVDKMTELLGELAVSRPDADPAEQLAAAEKITDMFGDAVGAVWSGFVNMVDMQTQINGVDVRIYATKGREC